MDAMMKVDKTTLPPLAFFETNAGKDSVEEIGSQWAAKLEDTLSVDGIFKNALESILNHKLRLKFVLADKRRPAPSTNTYLSTNIFTTYNTNVKKFMTNSNSIKSNKAKTATQQ